MKNFTPGWILLFLFGQLYVNAQSSLRVSLQWEPEPIHYKIGNAKYERWRFNGSFENSADPSLPVFIQQIPVNSAGELNVQLTNARFEPFDKTPAPGDNLLKENIQFSTEVYRERQGYTGKIAFIPIIRRGNSYERLVEGELRITQTPRLGIEQRGPTGTMVSVLKEGDIYKIAINKDGVYKLTYDFLKNKLGISNLDNIDPRNIKIYGNGGGILPSYTVTDRPDDLIENSILVQGEEDGKFNETDYILFYAEGPDKWRYDASSKEFNLEKNIYDIKNYYFIKISGDRGKRIENQNSVSGTAYTTTTFNDFEHYEEDKVNLLHDWGVRTGLTQGSGQRWFGDWFRTAREYTYNNLFTFSNLVTSSPAKIKAQMALRALQNSRFNLIINGETLSSSLAPGVSSLTDNETTYAFISEVNTNLTLNSDNINAVVRYPNPGGSNDNSEGWLDYIQVNVRRKLMMSGNQMDFRDIETLSYPSATFQLDNANANLLIWDISNPLQPKNQLFDLNNNRITFGALTNTLKTFIAFDKNQNFQLPESVGKIANQNIHGYDQLDMLIVYHPDFETEAQRLAQHRAQHSDLTVAAVSVNQIYNEFSSGKTDPTAIRDLAKLLYERNNRFKYLLLFGDGSFDTRNIYGLGGNFIPVYEKENFDPIETFPSDDYFAILNNASETSPLSGNMTIAIGRLPVKTADEAQAVVNKIVNYDTNQETFSDWRNQLVFVGDDEDGSQHSKDANSIADTIRSQVRSVNIDKIYLDAFPQVAASGGARFPEAKAELNRAIFKGALTVTYLGHGGQSGWAQERVLEISDIVNWDNFDRLPLFVTATCSFTGYDNPTFTSAGEETLLNPRGGAIALMTTVRAVYANANADLTKATMKQLFQPENGHYLTMGEAFRQAKNSFTSPFTITNSRKYSLIGDPSMHLAIPQSRVATTRVNGKDISQVLADTLRALQKVTVEGIVTDQNGQPLTNFNGIVYPTVFDKATTVTTLGQDPGSTPFPFVVQRNIIFKGRASATNGVFKFTFVVPKDINYQFGKGKINYYAADADQMTDASGAFEQVIIGGTNPDAVADNQGPKVDVYMNTDDWIFGSITNPNPTLLVKLEDDNGINVVGNSIGHDLEGVLDQSTQNSFLLNDFYEAELDDYTKGTVRYPLYKLAEGRHQMRVTAWDVANNAAQGYTEFIVAASEDVALQHVFNYPNPFTDRTCFQFDHNLANQEMDVQIQIFTISGRLVKTIQTQILSDGALRQDDCIEWDGKDDYGDRLARGVYLYKVKVRGATAGINQMKGESDFEKLVILK